MSASTPAVDRRRASGKLTIALLLGAALAASCGAIWYYRHEQRLPLELWGANQAELILRAPQVEALRLAAGGGDAVPGAISIDGQSLYVVERRDVAQARGVVHMRPGLLSGRTFDWSQTTELPPAECVWGLLFVQGDERAMLLFSEDCRRVRTARDPRSASLAPAAAAYADFFRATFAAESAREGAPRN